MTISCQMCLAENGEMQDPVCLPYCGHSFCRACIWSWFVKHDSISENPCCPNCTQSIQGIRILDLAINPCWNDCQTADQWFSSYCYWQNQTQVLAEPYAGMSSTLSNRYLLKAALQNHPEALYQMYLQKQYSNAEEADQWLRKAALHGHQSATLLVHPPRSSSSSSSSSYSSSSDGQVAVVSSSKRKHYELTVLLKEHGICRPLTAKEQFIQDMIDTFSYQISGYRPLTKPQKRAQLIQHWEQMHINEKQRWVDKHQMDSDAFDRRKQDWFQTHPDYARLYERKSKRPKRVVVSNHSEPLVAIVVASTD